MLHTVNPRCAVCHRHKIAMQEPLTTSCSLCGTVFEADDTCPQGHYVCGLCRQKAVREAMMAHCLSSDCRDPYPLVLELMKLPDTLMHGPEHHLLLTAALLTCYCNQLGREAELPALLQLANQRSLQVPGAACGFWGICGAAIGTGIYSSIVTESSPYAQEVWRDSGQLTVKSANAISSRGGPRCCKRDTFLAMREAVAHSNQYLGTEMALPDQIECVFYPNNSECKGPLCDFFPAG